MSNLRKATKNNKKIGEMNRNGGILYVYCRRIW